MSETRVEYRAGRGCMERQPHWRVLQGMMSEQQAALRRWLKGDDGISEETREVIVRVHRRRILALHEAIKLMHREVGQ